MKRGILSVFSNFNNESADLDNIPLDEHDKMNYVLLYLQLETSWITFDSVIQVFFFLALLHKLMKEAKKSRG